MRCPARRAAERSVNIIGSSAETSHSPSNPVLAPSKLREGRGPRRRFRPQKVKRMQKAADGLT